MNHRKLSFLALILITGLSTNASIILQTNFDTALPNPRVSDTPGVDTLTGIGWTGDDLVNVLPSSSMSYGLLDGDAGATTRGFHGGSWGNQGFAPDINVENYADWEATITFDLLFGSTGTMDGLSFDYQGLTNSAGIQGSGKAVPFNITVNGNAFDVTKTASTGSGAGSLSFTDSEALVSGTNTITISTDFYANSTGWNIGIDNLEFTGEITGTSYVPEPGTSALLAVGLMVLSGCNRRR